MKADTSSSVALDPNTFSLRPEHKRRFKPQDVKAVIRQVLVSKLEGVDYNADAVINLIKEITDTVRDKVRDLDYRNYKILVHCLVGEQRGEGLRMGSKCFWDADTDNVAEEVYTTKQLFAVCCVYGIYQY
jgi:hypothetical protein